jgi:Family of unknown function (DUF6152)
MKVLRLAALVLALGLLAEMIPAAHHSSAPFYDPTKKVEMQGVVTKFAFRNPHAFLYLDATDAQGVKTEWQVELGAPIGLRRTGWTPETIKPGMELKVAGQPSRAPGSHGICCARITRLDGSPIVAGGRVQEEQQPPGSAPAR